MTDHVHHSNSNYVGDPDYKPYDKRRLSYAGTFTDPRKANTIRTIEWLTGKLTLLRLIRQFEARGPALGEEFWQRTLDVMGIDLKTPEEQIARIPREGPVVVVANHPHGLVDGLVMGRLVARVRQDFKILTRSLLTGIDEIAYHMVPVPFPHEENSLQKSLEMRRHAMEHLADGGVVILFPSGQVAASETWFGPAVEAEWNPFTAKMVLRSGATVLPIYFPGQNSRWYQIANRISPTVRQGLLLHEIAHALNKPQAPVIGAPLAPEEIKDWSSNPRGFMAWLRETTLALG
ncbi:lysophospholipid acyltransferase family protein [Acidimangrovimonas pyrenivorans]|uniref:Lysophospholipid acyltransferase family protein n=1 Tax=Acidimangrovimonas pyrenivorans TaxID=2030798 RepID=A0ABV7AKU7_9RHOB